MYINPTIKQLFKYAKSFEKMQRGSKSVSKRKLAHQYVSLLFKSRIDLVFLLDSQTISKFSRLEQFKLMKLLCDIYGKPSTWKQFEGKPSPCKALLTLEEEYLDAFSSTKFYDFSYAFRDFHDHLHPNYRYRVDEEIIMLADRPEPRLSFWQKIKWWLTQSKFTNKSQSNYDPELGF